MVIKLSLTTLCVRLTRLPPIWETFVHPTMFLLSSRPNVLYRLLQGIVGLGLREHNRLSALMFKRNVDLPVLWTTALGCELVTYLHRSFVVRKRRCLLLGWWSYFLELCFRALDLGELDTRILNLVFRPLDLLELDIGVIKVGILTACWQLAPAVISILLWGLPYEASVLCINPLLQLRLLVALALGLSGRQHD